ncbi:MAG: hypothetical protein HZA58_10120 [Acidimicrobiia bacterium]|nr:hypothetical protein [Acidimicrobiia bacterium]
MNEDDRSLRNITYGLFVELGRAPTVREVAARLERTPDEVAAGWRRLHADHALVLQDRTDEIRMANPFSAVPTAYRVHADGRWWFAPCAWDAFGVLAALHADGRIEASCPDCGDPIEVDVRARRPDTDTLQFHCLVPASSWWDEIEFT